MALESSMESEKYTNRRIPGLKGSENWQIWSLRARSYLTQHQLDDMLSIPTREQPIAPNQQDASQLTEDQLSAYNHLLALYRDQEVEYQAYKEMYMAKSYRAASIIRNLLEDGPLIQTQHAPTAYELWQQLQRLYEPTGFVSEFLLADQLFSTTLSACNYKMEVYLTKIKRLSDQLASRNLTLPTGILAAYTLSKLGQDYASIVGVITQTYRQIGSSSNIDLNQLFSQLLDEEKRVKVRNVDTEMALTTQNRFKGNKQNLKCQYCKKRGHKIENCYQKYPEKRPQSVPKALITTKESEQLALFAKGSPNEGEWILDSGSSSHISPHKHLF